MRPPRRVKMRLAPKAQRRSPQVLSTHGAGLAVPALAALHKGAASRDEQEDDGADGDTGDGGGGEADAGGGRGGGEGGVGDLDGGLDKDGVVEADDMAGGGLLLAACFEGDEDCDGG